MSRPTRCPTPCSLAGPPEFSLDGGGHQSPRVGHSSIQVTVDTYGHLIPGANVWLVDRLDGVVAEKAKTIPQSAPPAQPGEMKVPLDLRKLLKRLVAAVGLEPTTYGL